VAEWTGEERRKEREYCPAHIEQVADMAVIKNSLISIEKSITMNATFKMSMFTSLLGIAIALIVQIVVFSYLYGGLVKQVEINTHRWENLDSDSRVKVEDIKQSLKEQLEQLRIEIRNPQVYKIK
jgi:hypothetical protein